MAESVPSLTCSQCGFVNEVERVYCHNCGAKLDRSMLPREDDDKTRESIERTRKRVKKMTNPGESPVIRELKAAGKVLGWAIAVAIVYLLLREPENTPDPRGELGQRMVSSEVAMAVESGEARVLTFAEADVNAHLKSAVKRRAGGIPGVDFERAFVRLEPRVCRIGMQQSLWGYPFYSGIAYKVEVKDGQMVSEQIGGNFGRLAVHPALMRYADFAFQKLWAALKREQEQLNRMQTIVLQKGQVVVVTKSGR